VLAPQADCGRASATVRLRLSGGRYFDSHVENAVSSIERPLTDGELSAKFTDLVAPVFGEASAARLLGVIWSMGSGSEPLDLARALASLPGRAGAEPATVPRPNEGARTASARLAGFVAGVTAGQVPESLRAGARQAIALIREAAADDRAPEYRALTLVRTARAGPRTDLGPPVAAAVVALGSADETAVVAGLEVCARIAAALNLRDHPEWLESGSLGQVGAAMPAARLLALDPAETLAALGIAATMTSGLAAAPGPDAAWLPSAKAASDGVLAARLAAAGMDGPAAPVEGPRGMGALLAAGHCDTAVLTDGLGKSWLSRSLASAADRAFIQGQTITPISPRCRARFLSMIDAPAPAKHLPQFAHGT